jgi:hypothetical protein
MRGLKSFLKKTDIRLKRRRGGACFVDGRGLKYKGLTKFLDARYFGGSLDGATFRGRDPLRWNANGRERGRRVDAQLTSIVNKRGGRAGANSYVLTRVVLEFLSSRGLEPLVCQRAVGASRLRLATAIDLLCYCEKSGAIFVCELKIGFCGDREVSRNRMKAPFAKASDNALNRHAMQSFFGKELLLREDGFEETLRSKFGIRDVVACVLYANGTSVDLVVPDESWWAKRVRRVLGFREE